MKKIIWIIVIIVIILTGGIFYVSQVNNKSLFSTADEIFKGLNIIPTEAEKFEKILPKQIGDYERESIPSNAEAREECQNIEDHPDTKATGIKGEICMEQAGVTYEQKPGNMKVRIILAKITSGKEIAAAFFDKFNKTTQKGTLDGYPIFQPERHEINWYPKSDFYIVLTQEYYILKDGNIDYNRTATGDNPVTKYFFEKYRPATK